MGKRVVIFADEFAPQVQFIRMNVGHTFSVFVHLIDRADLKIIHKEKPCLAIVLQHEGDDSAIRLVEQISLHHINLPILYVAVHSSKDELLAIIHAGAGDLLTVPFDKADLDECLTRLCRRHHIRIKQPEHQSETLFATIKKYSRRFHKDQPMHPTPGNLHNTAHSSSTQPSAQYAALVLGKQEQPKIQTVQIPIEAPNDQTPAYIEEYPSKSCRLDIHFFGAFETKVNGKLVTAWPGKKCKQLFAYLVYKRRPVLRDVLMEQFWSGFSQDSARNCLNVTLHHLRSTLQTDQEMDYVIFKDECYFFNPEISINSDVDAFRRHMKCGNREEIKQNIESALQEYETAASIYQGDFLSDYLYESWCELERENLKEIYLLILNKLSHYYSLNGKPNAAIDMCQRILAEDPCREDAHRRLMRCYGRIGQKDKELKQFEKCRTILNREFDTEPCKTTKILYEKIKKK